MSQLHLTEIGRVVIPSADVDETFADGQMRWVELVPPGSSTALAISPPAPGVEAQPIQSGIIISTSDVEADHKALKDEGVDVDEEIMRAPPPIPPMFQVRDPNGNSVWIVQPLQ